MGATSLIYIWVRQTTDWEDERAFLAQLDPEFKSRVDLWNATFNIPFHVFRAEVKRIAQLNLSRVKNTTCAGWDEIPEGALVLPVDDDDWFAPDIGEALKEADPPGATGYHWTRAFFQVPLHLRHRLGLIRRRLFPQTPAKYFCASNNYALVKRAGARPLHESHVLAGEWFERQDSETVGRIEQQLSAMNRTLASRTSLGADNPPLIRAKLLRRFREYGDLYAKPTAPGLAWCRPYLAMMDELMSELRTR